MLCWWITRITTEVTTMTRMHNPPHPGLIFKEDVLPALKMSVTEFASHLGVSRVALSRVINGKAAISPELAIRLAAAFGTSSPEVWLQMQAAYDLWHAQKRKRPRIGRLETRVA